MVDSFTCNRQDRDYQEVKQNLERKQHATMGFDFDR